MYILLIIVVIVLMAAIYDGHRISRKQDELNAFTDRQNQLREQMKDISLMQARTLKGLVEMGSISREQFYHEMDLLNQQCLMHGLDGDILKDIKPDRILTRMDVNQCLTSLSARLRINTGKDELEIKNNLPRSTDVQ